MRGDVLRKHPPHTPPKPFYKINNINPPTDTSLNFTCSLVGGFLLLILQRGLGGARGGYFLKIPSPVYSSHLYIKSRSTCDIAELFFV